MKTATLGQIFGGALIILGALGLIAAAILSFTIYAGLDQGALPAVSFFLIIIGMAFTFPSMLADDTGEVSTMRIVVFVVTMIFAIVHLKIGWTAGSFSDFEIDQTWIYILGLAFGSKAFQKMTENEEESVSVRKKKTVIKEEAEVKKED